MRIRVILPVVAAVAVLVWAPTPSEAATRRITFTNNTGQQANDLHVEFDQAVTPQPPAGPWGPFPNENPVGQNNRNFSGGTVNNGGSATITFQNAGTKITIKKWWWTKDGRQIGKVMGEKAVAMVHFDQDSARLAETLTVNLFALADVDQDASFEVSYSITDPDGLVASHPPLFLDIPAGTGLHQELEVSQAGLLGTYTISWETVDLATGDVEDGTSTVDVDSGVFPREPEPIGTINVLN
jgi:hypothetical protein